MKKIDCFIPLGEAVQALHSIDYLNNSSVVNRVFLLTTNPEYSLPGYETIVVDNLQSSATVAQIVAKAEAEYVLIYTKTTVVGMGYFSLERMVKIADETNAGMLYSDYNNVQSGRFQPVPLIDYQEGSVRDDFDFGPVLLYRTEALRQSVAETTEAYQFAGLYNLRLKVSQNYPLVHLNEFLYTNLEQDECKSGEKQFDYVDRSARVVQNGMAGSLN